MSHLDPYADIFFAMLVALTLDKEVRLNVGVVDEIQQNLAVYKLKLDYGMHGTMTLGATLDRQSTVQFLDHIWHAAFDGWAAKREAANEFDCAYLRGLGIKP